MNRPSISASGQGETYTYMSKFALYNAYLQAIVLLSAGTSYMFFPSPTLSSLFHSTPPDPALCTIIAELMYVFGFGYIGSIWYRQWEFIYFSIPARLGLGGMAALAWVFGDEKRRSSALVVMMTLDVVGAVVSGWTLGSWNGKVVRKKGKGKQI